MDRGDEPATSIDSLQKNPALSSNAGSEAFRTCAPPMGRPSLLHEGLPVLLMALPAVTCCLLPILILVGASLGVVDLLVRPSTWAVGAVLLTIGAAVWILYVKFRHPHRTEAPREVGVPPDRLQGTEGPSGSDGPPAELGGLIHQGGRIGDRWMEKDDRGGE